MKPLLRATALLICILTLSACATPSPSAPEPATDVPAEGVETIDYGVLDSLGSECADPEGDGALGADLTGAELVTSQGLLFITFRLAGNVQAADFDTATLQIFSYGLDGNGGYIIGTTFSGGVESSAFVFDNSEAKQENLSNGVVFADGTIAMRAPLSSVAGLADGFTWRATLSVNGVDVDECAEVTVDV